MTRSNRAGVIVDIATARHMVKSKAVTNYISVDPVHGVLRRTSLLPRCEHGVYNSGYPGEPSPYCSGCVPPGPLSPPNNDDVIEVFCPQCGEILDYDIQSEAFNCTECDMEEI